MLIADHLESLSKTRSWGYHSKKGKMSRTRIFRFIEGIVGYSGRVNWCIGSFNTTIYSTGKNGISQIKTPVGWQHCLAYGNRKRNSTVAILAVKSTLNIVVWANRTGRRRGPARSDWRVCFACKQWERRTACFRNFVDHNHESGGTHSTNDVFAPLVGVFLRFSLDDMKPLSSTPNVSTDSGSTWVFSIFFLLWVTRSTRRIVGCRLDGTPNERYGVTSILLYIGWSRVNITIHYPPVDEGLYRDLADEILRELTSQLYDKKRRTSYDLD